MSRTENETVQHSRNQVDMLHGPLMKKIILFALPLALSSILQQLFNAADTAVIGRFASSDSMAAVGATAILINLLLGLFIGLSVGANVVVASLIGRDEKRRISSAVHTSIAIAIVSGIVMLAVTFFLSRPMLEMVNTPGNIIDRSVLYMRIYAVGVPFIMVYNFAAAVLRSMGDSRRPFLALVAGGILNVLLNLLFVIAFRMDVSGVAIATVISNVVSAGILFVVLLKEAEPFRLYPKKIRISRSDFAWIFKIGAPAGLQGIVFSFSNMVIQSAINGFGSDAIAGTTAALNFDFVCYLFIAAFNQAATTFTSQNYAAGKYDRCRVIYRICFITALVISQSLCLFFCATCEFWLGIFTTSASVVAFGKVRFAFAMLFGGVPAIYEITGSTMRGMGVSLLPAMLTVFGTCATRILWIFFILPLNRTFEMIMVIYPVSWGLTAVMIMIAFHFVWKKKILAAGKG